MTLLHDPLHDLVGVVSTTSSRELESRSLVCLHDIACGRCVRVLVLLHVVRCCTRESSSNCVSFREKIRSDQIVGFHDATAYMYTTRDATQFRDAWAPHTQTQRLGVRG